MASKGNTWCKKLMTKGRNHALGLKLGTFKPHSQATSQDAAIEAKRVREFNAPMVSNFKPKRRGNGCRLSPAKRAMVELRTTQRAAFFAALES